MRISDWSSDVCSSDRFGVMSHATIEAFYDPAAVSALRERLTARTGGVILVGWGAAWLAGTADLTVPGELARWEIQLRYRAGMPNRSEERRVGKEGVGRWRSRWAP